MKAIIEKLNKDYEFTVLKMAEIENDKNECFQKFSSSEDRVLLQETYEKASRNWIRENENMHALITAIRALESITI